MAVECLSIVSSPLHRCLLDAFTGLQQAGVSWLLLRGGDDLLLPDGDVDLLVAPADLVRTRRILSLAGFQEIRAEGHGSHRFFVTYDVEADHWIRLDLVTDLRFAGGAPLPASVTDEVLAGRIRDGRWWSPAASDAFWHLFLHCALDKPVDETGIRDERWAELARLAASAGIDGPLADIASRFVDPAAVLIAARRGRREDVVDAAIRAHHEAGAGRRRSLRSRLGQRLGGHLAGGGRVVAVLGPDGAGKSTITVGLRDLSPLPTRVLYLGLPKPGPVGRAVARLPLGFFLLQLVTVFVVSLKVRAHTALGRLVLLDRHPLDWQAAPDRDRLTRRERFKRGLITAVAPRPDLFLVLDAPAEVMFARKGEHDIERLAAAREGYAAIVTSRRDAHLIDALQTPAEVRAEASRLIWDRVRPPRAGEVRTGNDHVRGSMLMLLGQVGSMSVTFAAQVIVVRHLSAADYGALAWAMGIVGILQAVLPLGLDRVDTKFLSEFRVRGNARGTLWFLLAPSTLVLALGLVVGVSIGLAWSWVEQEAVADPTTASVLLVVLALGPAQAIDVLLSNAFAVFAKPTAIFVRRYVLHPGLRLAAVLAMVVLDRGVAFLAWSYLLIGLLLTVVYATGLAAVVRRSGDVLGVPLRDAGVDRRAVFTLALPSLFAQIVALVSTELAGVALGWFHTAEDVASFRAMVPLAMLNYLVLFSFSTLYLPQAGRLLSAGDLAGFRDLHWRTACWVMTLTAPVFLLTVPFGGEVAGAILGPTYHDSGVLLSIVSAGYFLSSAAGFNGSAVMLLERRRWLWATNMTLLLVGGATQLIVISKWGALGAAIAVAVTVTVQVLLNQIGATWRSPLGAIRRDAAITFVSILATAAGCAVIAANTDLSLVWVLLIVAVCGLALLKVNAGRARIGETFPELARIPGVAWLVKA